MLQFFHDLFAQMPWLRIFLQWALASAIVLLVLAAPAYFLFLPIARSIKNSVIAHLKAIQNLHANKRSERQQAFDDFILQFGQDRLLRHLGQAAKFWAVTKHLITERTTSIQQVLRSISSKLDEFANSLPEVHEQLTKTEAGLPADLQKVGNSPELQAATA